VLCDSFDALTPMAKWQQRHPAHKRIHANDLCGFFFWTTTEKTEGDQLTQAHLKTAVETRTHNHFTAFWTLSGTSRVSRHQKEHFAIFWIFWSKMKITQAEAPTIRMDCHAIQTNCCPHLCHPTMFIQDALPYTTLPIYLGLGQAPSMLACIPGGLAVVYPLPSGLVHYPV